MGFGVGAKWILKPQWVAGGAILAFLSACDFISQPKLNQTQISASAISSSPALPITTGPTNLPPIATPTIAPVSTATPSISLTPTPIPTVTPQPTSSASTSPTPMGPAYYVSNTGSDANAGTSANAPWKTLSKVMSAFAAKTIHPGDNVLFNRGEVWREQMTLPYPTVAGAAGTSTAPITFGAYGSGTLPIITGANQVSAWTTVTANSNNYVLDSTMQAAWLFGDATSATYLSSTSNANALTVTTKTSSSSVPPGFSGTSADLTNGPASIVPASMSASLVGHAAAANFTLGGWVNLNTLGGFKSFVQLTESGTKGFSLMADTGGRFYPVVCTTGSGCVQGSVFPKMSVHTWTHVIVRVTSSTQKLEVFFNGVKQLNTLTIPSGSLNPAPNASLVFGGGGSTGLFFQWFSESTALSDANIISIYKNGLATKNVTAYSSPLAVRPNQVFQNAQRMDPYGQLSGLPLNSFYYDVNAGLLYVRTATDANPSSAVIEASQRSYGIYGNCNDYGYLNFKDLQIQMTNAQGIYNCGGSHFLYQGLTVNSNFDQGIRLDGGTDHAATHVTAAYNGSDGIAFDTVPNILVDSCIAHDNVQIEGHQFASGIKVEPDFGTSSSTNTLIQNSIAYNNGINRQIPFTGSGIWIDTVGDGAVIRNNIVYNNNDMGINIDASYNSLIIGNVSYHNLIGGIGAYADGETSVYGHKIINNTVYGNDGFGIQISGPVLGYTSHGCMNMLVADNIAVGTTNGPNLQAVTGCENSGSTGSGNVIEYNDLGVAATSLIQWGSTFYSTYSVWETAAGNCGSAGCTHSLQVDPLFVNANANNFSLQSTSPARNIGLAISGINQSVNPQGAIDLGAQPNP